MEMILIWPRQGEESRLEQVLLFALENITVKQIIREPAQLKKAVHEKKLQKERLLFAMSLGEAGINLKLYEMLAILRTNGECLQDSVAGILVDGNGEAYTKFIAREVVRTANEAGCWFVGRPLAEGTGSLQNYKIIAGNENCTFYEAYLRSAKETVERVAAFQKPVYINPKLLCVHACNPSTSNTLQLWREVKAKLPAEIQVQEISLRNGTVSDCAGCSYDMCMYFSQNSSCFYGGPIVEEVYPALEECNGLVLLCPNYNDALGANLTAFINRLTALFRKKPFADKCLFSLIVSGYSGGDILEQQLIGSLNMNKSFILPGNFAMTETANQPGSILEIRDIHKKTSEFATRIASCMTDFQRNNH
ncbi:MAG: NAD(P)H-dependent oxidoreductase [Eubacteriales bacterium]|nr:NAD(P)H-dependent oxidoreductase [Eubacteriales bacterium]